MLYHKLSVGDVYEEIVLETCYGAKGTTRPRVRATNGLPSDLYVDFPRDLRDHNPVGSRFKAKVKVCQKHDAHGHPLGMPYLYAYRDSITVLDNTINDDSMFPIRLPTCSERSYIYQKNKYPMK